MASREQNERIFGQWRELAGGGRSYWLDVAGRHGWRARYLKEVDASEITVSFWQEIYDEASKLVEVHQ
jgi:hypothetical protein